MLQICKAFRMIEHLKKVLLKLEEKSSQFEIHYDSLERKASTMWRGHIATIKRTQSKQTVASEVKKLRFEVRVHCFCLAKRTHRRSLARCTKSIENRSISISRFSVEDWEKVNEENLFRRE